MQVAEEVKKEEALTPVVAVEPEQKEEEATEPVKEQPKFLKKTQ